MKNCNYDTKGRMVSYENDYGDTITDYDVLREDLGIDRDSDTGGSRGGEGIAVNIELAKILAFIGTMLAGVLIDIFVWVWFPVVAAIFITIFLIIIPIFVFVVV